MVRRITRDATTRKVIEDLRLPNYLAKRNAGIDRCYDKRIDRKMKQPTDIETEMFILAVDEGNGNDPLDELIDPKDASIYRAIVARVNFLAADRSDVQFASKEASRRMSAPRLRDWGLLKRIGRYLLGRPRAVQWFRWQDCPGHFSVYTDSNWAGCKESRKSTSGACLMIGNHVLKSYSRTQSNIALSSGEAELYATVTAASEGLGLTAMAKDFGMDIRSSIYVDATAAIGIAERKGLGKVRHLDTQALWIQDAVRSRRVLLEKVKGTENPADMMTKHLDQRHLDELLSRISLEIVEGRSMLAPKLDHGEGAEKMKGNSDWVKKATEAKKKVRWADVEDDEDENGIYSLDMTGMGGDDDCNEHGSDGNDDCDEHGYEHPCDACDPVDASNSLVTPMTPRTMSAPPKMMRTKSPFSLRSGRRRSCSAGTTRSPGQRSVVIQFRLYSMYPGSRPEQCSIGIENRCESDSILTNKKRCKDNVARTVSPLHRDAEVGSEGRCISTPTHSHRHLEQAHRHNLRNHDHRARESKNEGECEEMRGDARR